MKCLNCGTTFSCGCQRRIASDGAQVCSSCIVRYEENLKTKQNEDDKQEEDELLKNTKNEKL